ncbi:DNA repair protein RecN [Paenalcaligenes niemegkensis]|uniref:DNA repair protein RecN n=1 Tax=Paenalcaligenes niemegkensis TaxID=2895469 RepID=UPI001EE8C14E|nr:DNA repair protein RecN [Paenalcaligenes niemegkensis]MCQ9617007.1 DNA repair protein RecN [Paenalcaligenes niemegkensis]
MLRSLHIRDFVIVSQANIEFDNGFTVFSGETGAGKSILIDALSLALGARGDAKVIRENCPKADISAQFECTAAVTSWLSEHEFDADDDLLLRRVIDSQGRSRAFINGAPATLTQLRDIGELLVDIHGQHAHQSLLKTAKQYELLDSQGGHSHLARQVHRAWSEWQDAQRRHQLAAEQADILANEREQLEWKLGEFQNLDLQEGEWETVSDEHQRLAHSQTLIDGTSTTLQLLDADENSAQLALNTAAHEIQAILRHDTHLQQIFDTIESARIACAEAISDLNSYVSNMELDPDRLAIAEARMAEIFSLSRKYKCQPEELLQAQGELERRLAELNEASDLQQLEELVASAKNNYDTLARQLTQARTATSKALSLQVTDAMQALSMQGGQFRVAITPAKASAHGNENIEFLVSGHAGVSPAPLSRVASGGELARISLALAVIASQAARVPTLIFDEVDTGIGGAVAEVVGTLLRKLGDRHQVLCVTHLPQVAAQGQHHFQVSKNSRKSGTTSNIETLSADGRVEEISRMLGGIEITETTRRHAKEMLQH